MTGLRAYDRDLELPARLGDADLALPGTPELLERVRRELSVPDAPELVGGELVYARWKPGIATLGVWEVALASGGSRLFTAKRYRDPEKLAGLADRRFDDEHLAATLGPFRALAVDAGAHLALWAFPADRALRGVARAVHGHRAARLVQDALGLGELALKKRKSRVELLRYKPERRAVVALEAPRRGELAPGEARHVRAVLRVHPPDRAARIFERRAACAAANEVGPRAIGLDAPSGTIVEEWLDGRPAGPDYANAAQVGGLLARLHAAPSLPPAAAARADADTASAWLERAGIDARRAFALPGAPIRAWIHGDLHPDQLWLDGGDGRLLDLDELRGGDVHEDLASWIADRLADAPETGFDDAAGELLAGYRAGGGAAPDHPRLRAAVAHALFERAAAALRRLEAGAVELARTRVERAGALLDGGGA